MEFIGIAEDVLSGEMDAAICRQTTTIANEVKEEEEGDQADEPMADVLRDINSTHTDGITSGVGGGGGSGSITGTRREDTSNGALNADATGVGSKSSLAATDGLSTCTRVQLAIQSRPQYS